MFNQKKYAQSGGSSTAPGSAIEDMHSRGDLANIGNDLSEQADQAYQTNKGNPKANLEPDKLQDENLQETAEQLIDIYTLQKAQEYLFNQGQEGRTVWYQLVNELKANDVANRSYYDGVEAELAQRPEAQALTPEILSQVENEVLGGKLGKRIQQLLTQQKEQKANANQNPNARIPAVPIAAFNLNRRKLAQVGSLETNPMAKAQFVAKYLPMLLGGGLHGKKTTEESERAKQEILRMISPAAVEEANSPLEKIENLSPVEQSNAEQILSYVYDNWVAPGCAGNQTVAPTMEPVMSKEQPKGIIKFNLSEHILNNKTAAMEKFAQESHFGQPYQLYGPTEKRICPKLRGKAGGYPGTGDVVSEYICRHHCLDGIVIDDNKTVCGEALWRANVMDKFSREYVDADGNIVGGYLNKRFEINRNVPEENKMRLKPGETRKPRPPEMGNLESRMQAMRAKEAAERDYRPSSNTGDPFVWSKDVDQNNVEASQDERNRREEAAGHETITQHGEENKPRLAKGFNLHFYKQADAVVPPEINNARNELKEMADSGVNLPQDKEVYPEQIDKLRQVKNKAETLNGKRNGRERVQLQAFNLKALKTAQGANIPLPEDGVPQQPVENKFREESKPPFNKPMTGPRGPVGEDNPASDDLGLSPDFDPRDDFDDKGKEPSYWIEEIISAVTYMDDRSEIVAYLNETLKNPEVASEMDVHDWDEVADEVNDHLRSTGQPELTREEFNYTKDMPPQHTPRLFPESFAGNKETVKEGGVTYKGEHFKYNPWAVCNKSTGGKNEAGEEKFERCVQHVKDQSRSKKKKKKSKEHKEHKEEKTERRKAAGWSFDFGLTKATAEEPKKKI